MLCRPVFVNAQVLYHNPTELCGVDYGKPACVWYTTHMCREHARSCDALRIKLMEYNNGQRYQG